MGMTVAEATAKVRRLITEKNAAFFPDADIYEELSDSQKDVACATGCCVKLSTFVVSDGKVTHTLPSNTREILQAWWISALNGTAYYPIEIANDDEVTMLYDINQRSEGQPTSLIRRGAASCEFRPIPSANAVCKIYYTTEPATVSTSGASFDSNFTDEFIRTAVIPRTAQKCLERSGEYDKAKDMERQYQEGVHNIKKYVSRWALKGRPVSQYQQAQPNNANTIRGMLT